MPQPKPRTSRATTGAALPAPSRDQLVKLLNPLEIILLTRERIQAVLDDAVGRGRMTRGDAADLAAALVERGRRQTEDLISDVEQLLGRSRDQLEDGTGGVRPTPRSKLAAPAERVLREVDRARVAAGIGPGFPVAGYDDLTAAQVTGRLGELTPAELRKVREYEQRNANRKSVLAAVEQKLR